MKKENQNTKNTTKKGGKNMKGLFTQNVAKVYVVTFQDYYVGKDGATFSYCFYSDEENAIKQCKELQAAQHANCSVSAVSKSRLNKNILSVIDNNCGYHVRKYVNTLGTIKIGLTTK